MHVLLLLRKIWSLIFLIDEQLQAHDRRQADIHMFAVYFLESVDVARSSTVNLKL